MPPAGAIDSGTILLKVLMRGTPNVITGRIPIAPNRCADAGPFETLGAGTISELAMPPAPLSP